jgi:diaphanous 1
MQIGRIPRLETRLECMLFRSRFDLDLQETIPDLEKLASATRQLRSSVKFKKVLQVRVSNPLGR